MRRYKNLFKSENPNPDDEVVELRNAVKLRLAIVLSKFSCHVFRHTFATRLNEAGRRWVRNLKNLK